MHANYKHHYKCYEDKFLHHDESVSARWISGGAKVVSYVSARNFTFLNAGVSLLLSV